MMPREGCYSPDGVWRACSDIYPQCLGRAGGGPNCCTCKVRGQWCENGCAIVPRKGMLCIQCANRELGRPSTELSSPEGETE